MKHSAFKKVDSLGKAEEIVFEMGGHVGPGANCILLGFVDNISEQAFAWWVREEASGLFECRMEYRTYGENIHATIKSTERKDYIFEGWDEWTKGLD